MTHLPSIQLYRGVAALLVVMYHLTNLELREMILGTNLEAPWLSQFWQNGFAGVDIFFIISGFLMVHVTRENPPGSRHAIRFLWARVARIFPLWWIFMVVYATAKYLIHIHWAISGEGWAGFSGTVSPAEYFWKSFFLIPQNDLPLLSVGWTLTHEVFFYSVFALGLWVSVVKRTWIFAGWAAIILLALPFLDNTIAETLWHLPLYPLSLEFIAGMLVAVACHKWHGRGALYVYALGLSIFFCILFAFRNEIPADTLRWGRLLWFGLPSAAIIYGAAGLDLRGESRLANIGLIGFISAMVFAASLPYNGAQISAPVNYVYMLYCVIFGFIIAAVFTHERLTEIANQWGKAWIAIGNASYTLYLSHILVFLAFVYASRFLQSNAVDLAMFNALAPVLTVNASGQTDNIIFLGLMFASALIFALLFYKWGERPIIAQTKKLTRSIFDQKNTRPPKDMRTPEV